MENLSPPLPNPLLLLRGKRITFLAERGFEFSPFQLTNFFLFPLLVGGGRGVRFRVGFST